MRGWLDTLGKVLWGVIGAIVLATIIVVVLVTQTDWGRGHVLAFGLKQLASRVHGYVSIQKLHGNLLTGARLDNVVITDSARRPFLQADTLELRYSLSSLLARHLVLSDVVLAHATVILDKPPGEEWNFARIFPTGPRKPRQKPGFGSWVLIQDMTVRRSTFVVRNEWAPPDSLRGRARQLAVEQALSPANRQWIVPVPGGWQSLSVFGALNAELPLMRVADPDSANRLFDIARLSMVAFPFKPPAALVRDMRARVVITKDSLLFDSLAFVLPGTRGAGLGAYALNGSGARVQLALGPVNFLDASFLYPAMPMGSGRLGLAFTSHKDRTHVIASNMDVRAEGATVTGLADFEIGPNFFRVGPSNVAFAGVETRLIKRYLPEAPLQVAGTLDGALRLVGTPASMKADGYTDFRELGGPMSRIGIDGRVGSGPGGFLANGLRLRFQPLQVALLRPYAPDLPYDGSITGSTTLNGSIGTRLEVAANLVHSSATTGRSHVTADGGIQIAGGLAARDLRVTMDPLQVAVIRPFTPRLPYGGTLTGAARFTGSPARGLSLVADVTHVDPRYGRSRLGADGRVAFRDGAMLPDHLQLRFAPAQVALARPFVQDLPYGGTVTGKATLTGSTRSSMAILADLVHVDPAIGRSHVTAAGSVRLAGGLATRNLHLGLDPLQVAVLRPFVPATRRLDGALTGRTNLTASLGSKQVAATLDVEHTGSGGYSHFIGNADAVWRRPGHFDVAVRAPALALGTVGAFLPAAGLRGNAAGDIVARGSLADLTTAANLTVTGGGAFSLRGNFDLAAARKRYDLTSTFSAFNAGAVTSHAPRTSLNGTLVARGAGMTAATADAFIEANLVGSSGAGSPRVDTALVTARLANGLASFQRGHVRLGSALADVSGSFGLVSSQSGTLNYSVRVDTISQFATHIPVDTGSVPPRALLRQRRFAAARADSARAAQATEVQRAAVGYPPAPRLHVDTLPMRRDTLAGSLQAQGTLTGNIKRFDARGTAQARDFTVGANHIGAGSASYSLLGYGSPAPQVHVDARASTIAASGFAFDSGHAVVSYNSMTANGRGTADIALFQDPRRDYRVQSVFDLALDRRQLGLQSLTLRFDTTTWQSTRPATVGWGKAGVDVANLELVNPQGGYVRANGRVPTSGAGDLRLDAEGVQIGDFAALIQDTASTQGLLGLHARIQGTTRAPVLAGTVGLVRARWGGNPFPDVRATFDYANADLRGHAQFFQGPLVLATAEGRVPVNLALSGVSGSRLLRDRPLSLDVHADSLPLESLPNFTTAVSDVRGRVRGDVAIRGTFDRPTSTGHLLLDLGSLRVNSSGVLYTDIIGGVRLTGDRAHVDSVVAHSGGTVRVAGDIDLKSFSRPGFDLTLTSAGATLLDNDRGRIRADANLTIRGPYTGLKVAGNATVTGGVVYAPEMNARHATNLDDPTLGGVVDTTGMGLVLPAPNPLLQNLQVDVALRVNPDTWVRNSQTNVEIYTPGDADPLQVHMDNAQQVLTLLGTINSDHGEYTYSGRVFQLSTGSATFIGGPALDPLLQLTAIYNVQRQGQENLAIQVNVSGTLRAPRVRLESNAQPPLSQSDLLSYLAFGQPASSLLSLQGSPGLTTGSGSGGALMGGVPGLVEQQVASLAIGAMIDQTVRDIEEQGTRAGLDVFRVHPGELPAEAAFQSYFNNFMRGTEFEMGKYLNPRLFVELRGRASTLPGVAIQYRQLNGFTWTTTWEPRYLPAIPSLSSNLNAFRVRSLGTFLLWNRRF